jgi:hypothetical protein
MGEAMNIIEMANESGLVYYGMGKDRAKFLHYLQAFAALVEAHEREECAQVAEQWLGPTKDRELHIAEAIRARGTT